MNEREKPTQPLHLGVQIRVGAVVLLALIWLLFSAVYATIAFKADKLDWTDVFKVSATMGGAFVAAYGAWHATKASAEDRRLAMQRHAELIDLQVGAAARDRRKRAFEILKALDEQDRVELRVEIRRTFDDLKDDLKAIKAELERNPGIEKSLSKVLGSFEDMCLAIRAHDVDESILFYSMGHVLVRYHRMFHVYIQGERDAQKALLSHWTPPAYCEIEYVGRAWMDGKSVQTGQNFERKDSLRPWKAEEAQLA